VAKRKLKEGKFKRVGREFAELLQACWQLSPKWTVVFWLYIGISAYDGVRIFIMGHGTFFHLWKIIEIIVKGLQ
jgi:hypothetical protein